MKRKRVHKKIVHLNEPNILNLESMTMEEYGYKLRKLIVRQINDKQKKVKSVWRR